MAARPRCLDNLQAIIAREQNDIRDLEKKKWFRRSQWTWETLLQTIARDQELFLRYCDRSLADKDLTDATNRRVFQHYSKQAIKLLGGGGTSISPSRQSKFQLPNPVDESDNPQLFTALNARGRIKSRSIFPQVNWLDCTSNDERRDAKKLTLHWFHHALRNMREYRNGRNPIPWTAECENTCRRIQKKLLNP